MTILKAVSTAVPFVGIVIQSGHETRLFLLENTMIPPYYLHFHKHRQQELAMGVLTPQLSIVEVVLEHHSKFLKTLIDR